MIGQPAELLLAGGTNANGFNPFRVTAPVRRRRPGSIAPMVRRHAVFSAAPLLDAEGRIVGARGIGVDWTEYDEHQGRVAAALRRGEVLDHILWRMGQEVLAPRMMQAALDALMNALGAEGAAVIDLRDQETPGAGASGRRRRRRGAAGRLGAACGGRWTDPGRWTGRPAGAGCGMPHALRRACRPGAVARARLTRLGPRGQVLLINAAASLVRMVLEHEAIQLEMGRQARTDPLTGLLNRRAFLEEMARHIDRLDREIEPGTLMFADLDYFKPVNDRLGHDVGRPGAAAHRQHAAQHGASDRPGGPAGRR